MEACLRPYKEFFNLQTRLGDLTDNPCGTFMQVTMKEGVIESSY